MTPLSMKSSGIWAVRILGTLLLAVLLYRSWRTAEASWLSNSQHLGDLQRAIEIEPDNPRYRLRLASRHLYATESTREGVESELREVLRWNPRSAEALMNLGALAEARNANVEAERLLTQAAAIDHTFKPIWTLANFHYRADRLDKMWPELKEALDLSTKPGMDFFEPGSIFDLFWQAGDDSRQLLALVPDRPRVLLNYFSYLVAHRHLDAAVEAFPRAMAGVDPTNRNDRDIFPIYCTHLAEAGQVAESVRVWNQMIEKHLVDSTILKPEVADSIANPVFAFPFEPLPFGWRRPVYAEVTMRYTPGSLLYELNGHQPETVVLLEKYLAVVPDREYLLTFSVDGSGIVKPIDPKDRGIEVFLYDRRRYDQYYDSRAKVTAVCSTFMASAKNEGCRFRAPSLDSTLRNGHMVLLSMVLTCKRLTGNVRLTGSFRLSGVSLAFADRTSP